MAHNESLGGQRGGNGVCPSAVPWTTLEPPWRKDVETQVHGNVGEGLRDNLSMSRESGPRGQSGTEEFPLPHPKACKLWEHVMVAAAADFPKLGGSGTTRGNQRK